MPSRPLLIPAFLTLAVSIASCEMPRPQGAYTPLEKKNGSDAAPDMVDPLTDAYVPTLGGGGGPGGGAAGGTGDGGGEGSTGGADTPLAQLQRELSGDYWIRADNYSTANTSAGTVDTHTTTYSLVKIGLDANDGQFKMVDWQCAISIDQDCSSPCSSASSTVRSGGGRAWLPAQRTITIDEASGAWSVSPCAYAIGWKWDFATQGDHWVPTAKDKDLLWDPDGGGDGVNVSVKVTAGFSSSCEIRLVQKIDLLYSGTLQNRAFATGTVTDHGSSQIVLDSGSCPSDTQAHQSMANTMRFARAPKAIDDKWTCPSEAEFKAALPSP